MSVRVKLSDGAEFVLNTSLEDFRKAVRLALENNQVLEVENGGGRMRLINPAQIVFIEQLDRDYEAVVADVSGHAAMSH